MIPVEDIQYFKMIVENVLPEALVSCKKTLEMLKIINEDISFASYQELISTVLSTILYQYKEVGYLCFIPTEYQTLKPYIN